MAEFAKLKVCSFILYSVYPTFPGEQLTSTGYLEGLGQQRLTYDLQTILNRDPGLRRASQRYYLEDDGVMSDFSD
jgi:hypothetical protein